MSGMPRTAFLHIGMHKTGTTAIQAACAASRPALEACGYRYFQVSANHSEPLAMAFWSPKDAVDLARLNYIDDANDAARQRAEQRDGFLAEVARTAPHHFIVSGEALSTFRTEEVADLINSLRPLVDRIRIIAYVREPLDWMTSAAQQATKWSGETLDHLFRSPRIAAFARTFTPFRDLVEPRDFDLRAYRPDLDIVEDFAKALSVERRALVAQGRVNSAVSAQGAVLLSAFNARSPAFIEGRHSPLRTYNALDLVGRTGGRFSLPVETVELAADALAADRDWLSNALPDTVFAVPKFPTVGLDHWFGPDRAAVEDHAIKLLDTATKAQNGAALAAYLRAQRQRASNPRGADTQLGVAWLLATDRESLGLIAAEAVAVNHPETAKIFAKQRLMRRILAPEAGDPPLGYGNPFDRNPPRVSVRASPVPTVALPHPCPLSQSAR